MNKNSYELLQLRFTILATHTQHIAVPAAFFDNKATAIHLDDELESNQIFILVILYSHTIWIKMSGCLYNLLLFIIQINETLHNLQKSTIIIQTKKVTPPGSPSF
jgi:hypothetical protein